MKLLIEIPENIVENAKSSPNYYPTYHFEKIWRAIAKGTPLSKGHGRLIDADELFKWHTGSKTKYPVTKDYSAYNTLMMYEVFDEIDNAPTIIEADKPDKGVEE